MKKLFLLTTALLVLPLSVEAGAYWDSQPPAACTGAFSFGATINSIEAGIVTLTAYVAGSYCGSETGSYGTVHIDAGGTASGETWVSVDCDAWNDDYDGEIAFLINESEPPTTPTSLTITSQTGTTASLSWVESTDNVAVTGYEIAINGTPALGVANSPYTLTGLQPGAYQFKLRAADAAGNTSGWSNTVSTTLVASAPAIITSPVGVTAGAGQNVVLAVGVSGDPWPTFQWKKNGSSITGATTPSYSLNNVQNGDAGGYTVVVTNIAGSVTSSSVTVTVNPAAPSITVQPQGLGYYVGQPTAVVLSVTAVGTQALTYQWRKDGANVSGATSATYTVTNPQSGLAGNYSVVVSNSVGSATSGTATVVLEKAPIRLALQYWQQGDYPDYPIFGYADVWVPGGMVEDGYWDENDNWVVTGEHWEDGYWESQWVQTGSYADGQYGSSWTTTEGTFQLSSSNSNFVPSSTNRGSTLYIQNNAQPFTYRAWAQAPESNCSSFTATLFPADGVTSVVAGTMTSGGYYQGSTDLSNGTYRLAVSYANATGTASPSGTVSYYIGAGGRGQWVAFDALPNREVGDPAFSISATTAVGYIGQNSTYSVVAGPATMNGIMVTVTGVGTVVLQASHAGGTWNGIAWAAGSVRKSFEVTKRSQTIAFHVPSTPLYVNAPIALTASTSSGQAVTWSVVSGPGTITSQGTNNGLLGKYWSNVVFSGNPVLTRIDSQVFFEWGSSSPGASIGSGGFSARWTGCVVPEYSETYTFEPQASTGVRLWLDGVLVAERWTEVGPGASCVVPLTAGVPVAIVMEYYRANNSSGIARLRWQSASQAGEWIPSSQLFDPAVIAPSGPGDIILQASVASTSTYFAATAQRTITVVCLPPAITVEPAVTGLVGQAVSLQLSATHTPVTWSATGLPTGLSISSSTGLISGTPTTAGTSNVSVSATNAGGTASRPGVFKIHGVPTITSSTTAGAQQDSAFSFTVTSAAEAIISAADMPPGLVLAGSTGVISGKPTEAGTFPVTLTASNPGGAAGGTLTITVSAAAIKPGITVQPKSATVIAGQNATFSVTAIGSGTLAYQWRKGGTDLSGQTTATLTLSSVQSSDEGNYRVHVSNSVGEGDSSIAVLALGSANLYSDIGGSAAGQNPNTDANNNGVPDLTETALGVTGNTAPVADQNQTNLKVQRPPQ